MKRFFVGLSILLVAGSTALAGSFEHLTELTGKVTAIVTLKGRDNFTSEYRYDVSVRNLSPDTYAADSLVIVLDRITNLAGEDREGLTGESFLKRFDVLGQDGETGEGKPFFRIPVGSASDLAPQTDSLPTSVRLRNRDYVAVFTPGFRIFGLKRTPPEPLRHSDEPASAATPGMPTSTTRAAIDKLIQLLIKKGVLTEEEWRKANQP